MEQQLPTLGVVLGVLVRAFPCPTDFDARVEAAKQEEAERKKAKKARKAEDNGDDDSGAGDVDPDMAAMMGFGSFGGSKK